MKAGFCFQSCLLEYRPVQLNVNIDTFGGTIAMECEQLDYLISMYIMKQFKTH